MENIAPHNRRVLIVDDNEDIRNALVDSLTLRGYYCVAADNGASALLCLDAERFHLVVTDYRMPTMDGIQFLETLKKHSTWDLPPVILLTADMSEELRRQALELGAYAVIAKPFASQELAVLSTHAMESREIEQSGLGEMRSE